MAPSRGSQWPCAAHFYFRRCVGRTAAGEIWSSRRRSSRPALGRPGCGERTFDCESVSDSNARRRSLNGRRQIDHKCKRIGQDHPARAERSNLRLPESSTEKFGSPVRLRTSDPVVNSSRVKLFVFNGEVSWQALRKASMAAAIMCLRCKSAVCACACMLQLQQKNAGYARKLSSGLRRGM